MSKRPGVISFASSRKAKWGQFIGHELNTVNKSILKVACEGGFRRKYFGFSLLLPATNREFAIRVEHKRPRDAAALSKNASSSSFNRVRVKMLALLLVQRLF